MKYLHKLSNVTGKYYEWNENMKELTGQSGFEYGVIAQEVQKEFPEIVKMRDDGYLTVDYIQLIPILIEAVKELKTELDLLKQNNECTCKCNK
jgi:hypothetical protein